VAVPHRNGKALKAWQRQACKTEKTAVALWLRRRVTNDRLRGVWARTRDQDGGVYAVAAASLLSPAACSTRQARGCASLRREHVTCLRIALLNRGGIMCVPGRFLLSVRGAVLPRRTLCQPARLGHFTTNRPPYPNCWHALLPCGMTHIQMCYLPPSAALYSMRGDIS